MSICAITFIFVNMAQATENTMGVLGHGDGHCRKCGTIIPIILACKTEERAGTYADILGLGVRSFSVFIKEFPNKRLLSEKSFVNLQPLKAIEV